MKEKQKELFEEIKLLRFEHRRLSVFVQNVFERCLNDGTYTKDTLIEMVSDVEKEAKFYKNKIDKLTKRVQDLIINKLNE